jgi:hypothetical protein
MPPLLCLALAWTGCSASKNGSASSSAPQEGKSKTVDVPAPSTHRASSKASGPAANGSSGKVPAYIAQWDRWVERNVKLGQTFVPLAEVQFLENHNFEEVRFEKIPGKLFLRSRMIPQGKSRHGNTIVLFDNGRQYGIRALYAGMADLSPAPNFHEARDFEPAARGSDTEIAPAPQSLP